MDINFHRSANLLFEAADLVSRQQTPFRASQNISGLDILEIYKYQKKRYNFSDKEADSLLNVIVLPLDEIINQALPAVEKISESVRKQYFSPVFSQADASIVSIVCEAINLLQVWEKDYSELSAGEKQLLNLSLLNFISSIENIAAPLPNLTDAVEEALTDNQEKWLFMKTLYEMETLIPKTKELLSPVISVLQKHSDTLQKIYDFACGHVEARLKKDGFDYLKSTWDMLPVKDIPLVVEIRIMRFLELSFFLSGHSQILRFGCACPTFRHTNQTPPPETITAIFKVLGDKRRMEIMRLLKQRPHYGNELAEKLKITPATISHHMNALMNNRLIVLEHDGTKLIYSINEELIHYFLQGISEILF